jgi:hypothetical protein
VVAVYAVVTWAIFGEGRRDHGDVTGTVTDLAFRLHLAFTLLTRPAQ